MAPIPPNVRVSVGTIASIESTPGSRRHRGPVRKTGNTQTLVQTLSGGAMVHAWVEMGALSIHVWGEPWLTRAHWLRYPRLGRVSRMPFDWPVDSSSHAGPATVGPSPSDTGHGPTAEQPLRKRPASASSRVNQSPPIKALRWLARIIPRGHLRTFIYLNFIERPRRLARLAFTTFYRTDPVYLVLREFANHKGRFSTLEFDPVAASPHCSRAC